MGDSAIYVWGSYILTLLTLLGEVLLLLRRSRATRQDLSAAAIGREQEVTR